MWSKNEHPHAILQWHTYSLVVKKAIQELVYSCNSPDKSMSAITPFWHSSSLNVSHVIIKLWRNQTTGALQPKVNNVLLTKKSKVVQEDASITPNKLWIRSSHCLPSKISAKLVVARANFGQDLFCTQWWVLLHVYNQYLLASVSGPSSLSPSWPCWVCLSTRSEVTIRATRTVRTQSH